MISLRMAVGIEAMIFDSFMFMSNLVPASWEVVMTWKCMMATSLPPGTLGLMIAFMALLPCWYWMVGTVLAPLPPNISTTERPWACVRATHAMFISLRLG